MLPQVITPTTASQQSDIRSSLTCFAFPPQLPPHLPSPVSPAQPLSSICLSGFLSIVNGDTNVSNPPLLSCPPTRLPLSTFQSVSPSHSFTTPPAVFPVSLHHHPPQTTSPTSCCTNLLNPPSFPRVCSKTHINIHHDPLCHFQPSISPSADNNPKKTARVRRAPDPLVHPPH